jgi:hypothetical protein
MYPVDTIKTRMQIDGSIKLDGLYKGVWGSLIGQVPYGYVFLFVCVVLSCVVCCFDSNYCFVQF